MYTGARQYTSPNTEAGSWHIVNENSHETWTDEHHRELFPLAICQKPLSCGESSN